MTEVYSVLNQAPSDDFWFIPLIFGAFCVGLLLFVLFSFHKMITTRKVPISKIFLSFVTMGFIALWVALFVFGISGDKRTYDEYCEALESNNCFVESGTPERIKIYRNGGTDEKDSYEITFYLNGKYFGNYFTYGGGDFSQRDMELIKNSDTIEVKYIVDENNDNIILSMSVGEKTD